MSLRRFVWIFITAILSFVKRERERYFANLLDRLSYIS
jgi:hypothetical protein